MSDTLFHHVVIGSIPVLYAAPGAPAESATRKLVIWLPGFSGDKEGVRDQLRDLAKAGYMGLSFDPVQHGERCSEGVEALRARVRGNIRRYFWPILAQTAEEVPSIIDWAVRELGVASAVGIGGISMGGDISVTAAGVDPRITTVVAACATADWLRPGSFETPGEPDAIAQACYDSRNPLTHLNLYSHCPAISFQCGAQDRQVPPDGAQRFVAALQAIYGPESDRLEVFLQPDTAHQFTPVMWQNGLRWFGKLLN